MKIKDDPLRMLDKFLKKQVSDKLLIGIDPGSNGAIALVELPTSLEHYTTLDIPRIKKKSARKEEFNLNKICVIFQLLQQNFDITRSVVVLEQIPVSVGRGRKFATVMINRAWAMWPLFLHSLGYRLIHASPLLWKKDLKLGKDKEHSRVKAKALFPRAEVSRHQDHDRAEALLLCHWALKKGLV